MRRALFAIALALLTGPGIAAEVLVQDAAQLRQALAHAEAGTTILLASGNYAGGLSAAGLRGTAERPIVLRAADPERPPVILGGGSAIHLSDVTGIELRDLTVEGSTGNGINIDDGGSPESPSQNIRIKKIVVRDVGPQGNRDGIKLSGLDDFSVENCTVERWGERGSGIDMVGCRRGLVAGCVFRHAAGKGDNGVQAKGGSREIVIRRCRFEDAGQRGVNIGGSTGLDYFRPRPEGFEARDITVEDCTFLGSLTPVAFVGIDGATVQHNTIYRPRRWGFCVLQENRSDGFVASRNGRFTDNIVAFRSDEMSVAVNVGPGTAVETFTLARNAWYCLDNPSHSRPRLPVAELDGKYGVDPGFRNAEQGDLQTKPEGPVAPAGIRDPSQATQVSAIGVRDRVGCGTNARRVQRLSITEPGLYENILIDGDWTDGTLVKIKADDVILRNCEIRNGTHNGITILGRNVVIDSCKIHHLLAGTFEDQHDAHGITGCPNDLVIRNCDIGLTSGDAIQFDPGRGAWNNVLVENCTLWTDALPDDAAGFRKGERPGENAIDTKQQISNARSQLTVRNCLLQGWNQPAQISNVAALNLKNHVEVHVANCLFRDNEICLRVRGGEGQYGGAIVTVEDCAAYDSFVAIRAEDDIRDLKIRRFGMGSGVRTAFMEAGGGVGPGYENVGGLELRSFNEVLKSGIAVSTQTHESPRAATE